MNGPSPEYINPGEQGVIPEPQPPSPPKEVIQEETQEVKREIPQIPESLGDLMEQASQRGGLEAITQRQGELNSRLVDVSEIRVLISTPETQSE